jgi:nucleobase:cation symporter-1, NCS1 family
MIADYYIVRKKELNLADLYRNEGEYTYPGGFNWSAVLALAAGIGSALVGKFIPAVDWCLTIPGSSGWVSLSLCTLY